MLEKVKEFINRDWTMEEKMLLLADVFLFGILLGALMSPLKKAVSGDRIVYVPEPSRVSEEDQKI